MFKHKIWKDIKKVYSSLFKLDGNVNKKQNLVVCNLATITSSIPSYYSKLGNNSHYYGVFRNQKLWFPLYDRLYSSNYSQARCYSSDSKGSRYQAITDLPIKISPDIVTHLYNYFTTFVVVKPSIDSNFNMGEFLMTSKKVVPVISHLLANGQVDSLEDLVTNNVWEQIKINLPKLSISERQKLATLEEDITVSMIYKISVFNDENANEKRLQILTIHHVIKGFGEFKKTNLNGNPLQMLQKESFQMEGKVHVLNYRFSRTYRSKDEGEDWIIDGLNHRPGSTIGFSQFFF